MKEKKSVAHLFIGAICLAYGIPHVTRKPHKRGVDLLWELASLLAINMDCSRACIERSEDGKGVVGGLLRGMFGDGVKKFALWGR